MGSRRSQGILPVALVVGGMSLTGVEQQTLELFLSQRHAGNYPEAPNPCLCGVRDDVEIARRDRYGIPLRTVLCRACGLMRSDPYLKTEALRRFYQEVYRPLYDGSISHSAAFARSVYHGETIDRFVSSVGLKIPSHVYEIGCGSGGNLVHFVLKGFQAAGCDEGSEFVGIGRKMGLDLRHGGLGTFGPSLPESLVILCHSLEHFPEPLGLLTDLRVVLPEGSQVYVELPGIFHIGETYGDLQTFLQNAHAYHYCLESLDFVMGLGGFQRIHGDESLKALYRKRSGGPFVLPDSGLSGRILEYLKGLGRRRWLSLARRLLRRR